MGDTVYLCANTAAVDAFLWAKEKTVERICNDLGISYDRVGVIGDERIDLPMLRMEGLGLIGTVANAQDEVKAYVGSQGHGHVSEYSVFDGFMDFYALCCKRGIELVIY